MPSFFVICNNNPESYNCQHYVDYDKKPFTKIHFLPPSVEYFKVKEPDNNISKIMENKQEKIKRIGIDARFFGPKDKGFGRYTENLIRNLEKIDPKNQYFIFLRKDSWNEYQSKNANFKKVLADYRWYGWKEQILLPLKLKKYKLDLVHFTHFNVPIFHQGKFIVTIHDLTLRHFPTFRRSLKNLIFYPFKNFAYRIIFRHAIKNSEKIIAISEYTKNDILKHYRVNPDKIKIIYEGIT